MFMPVNINLQVKETLYFFKSLNSRVWLTKIYRQGTTACTEKILMAHVIKFIIPTFSEKYFWFRF